MSKKKNTLKDLDAFLKQQAATIVPPATLSEKIDEIRESEDEKGSSVNMRMEKIISDLTDLSMKEKTNFRQSLYDLILRSVNAQPSPEAADTLLINTVLYLKHGDNWKDAIRNYWRKRYKSESR
jgi:hypothetical protein